MRSLSEKELEEMREDAEKARHFRDFANSAVWKKYLEPFLFKLQQDAETEAVVCFRVGRSHDEVVLRGAVASGRAQGAEEFALFIVRSIRDAKDSEQRLREIEADQKNEREAAK